MLVEVYVRSGCVVACQRREVICQRQQAGTVGAEHHLAMLGSHPNLKSVIPFQRIKNNDYWLINGQRRG